VTLTDTDAAFNHFLTFESHHHVSALEADNIIYSIVDYIFDDVIHMIYLGNIHP
jgi:hypothetical protein